jgi:hypothetical protein
LEAEDVYARVALAPRPTFRRTKGAGLKPGSILAARDQSAGECRHDKGADSVPETAQEL